MVFADNNSFFALHTYNVPEYMLCNSLCFKDLTVGFRLTKYGVTTCCHLLRMRRHTVLVSGHGFCFGNDPYCSRGAARNGMSWDNSRGQATFIRHTQRAPGVLLLIHTRRARLRWGATWRAGIWRLLPGAGGRQGRWSPCRSERYSCGISNSVDPRNEKSASVTLLPGQRSSDFCRGLGPAVGVTA